MLKYSAKFAVKSMSWFQFSIFGVLNAVSQTGPSFLVVVNTRIVRPANRIQETEWYEREAMSAHLKKSRRKQPNNEYDKKKKQ